MTEQHPDDDRVSRLLAAAAGPPPRTPEDVVARLDDTLAGLVAEGDLEPTASPAVTSLASRRRRWPQLTAAAAAVAVVALGIGNVLDTGAGDAGSASDAPAAAERGASPESAPGVVADDRTGVPETDALDGAAGRVGGAPRLRTGSLTADVQRVVDLSLSVGGRTDQPSWTGCPTPPTGPDGLALPVRLDGDRAVLVLRAPRGEQRRAEVYTCDDVRTPAASTTIDVR